MMLNMFQFHHCPEIAALGDKLADRLLMGDIAINEAIKEWNKAVIKHNLQGIYDFPNEGYDLDVLVWDLRRCADQLR